MGPSLVLKIFYGQFCYPNAPTSYRSIAWSHNERFLAVYSTDGLSLYDIRQETWCYTFDTKYIQQFSQSDKNLPNHGYIYLKLNDKQDILMCHQSRHCYYIKPIHLPHFRF